MNKQISINLIALILCLACILSCSRNKEIPVIKPEPILTLGEPDDPHEAFHKPKDVATDSKGNIYVLDTGNHRVVKFCCNRQQGEHLCTGHWKSSGGKI